jgi:hypothetical protein
MIATMITRNLQAEGWTNFPCVFVPWDGAARIIREMDAAGLRASRAGGGAPAVPRPFQSLVDVAVAHQGAARRALWKAAGMRGWNAALNENIGTLPPALPPIPSGIAVEIRGTASRAFQLLWSDGVRQDVAV